MNQPHSQPQEPYLLASSQQIPLPPIHSLISFWKFQGLQTLYCSSRSNTVVTPRLTINFSAPARNTCSSPLAYFACGYNVVIIPLLQGLRHNFHNHVQYHERISGSHTHANKLLTPTSLTLTSRACPQRPNVLLLLLLVGYSTLGVLALSRIHQNLQVLARLGWLARAIGSVGYGTILGLFRRGSLHL
jgi:hypothetical protein